LGALAAIVSPARVGLGLLLLAGLGLALWLGCGQLASAQPAAGWGTCVNHAERIMMVSGIALVLLGLEHLVRGNWQKSPPVRFVEVFGTSSLAAYFGHETMLYWPLVFGFSFHAVWGNRVGWPAYWGLTALLIAYTFVFTWAVAKVYDRVQRRPRSPRA
ncbi:MAG: heparan-alpha-glucosaminide N-acetyltransferase domain-containing protein, partial [Myxococcaceae bacterium]